MDFFGGALGIEDAEETVKKRASNARPYELKSIPTKAIIGETGKPDFSEAL